MPTINYLPRWSVLLLDLLICYVAFWLSVLVGSGIFEYGRLSSTWPLWKQSFTVIGVQLLTFWLFHTYSGILRFSTFIDTVKVLLANISAGLLLIAFNYMMEWTLGYHLVLNTLVAIYVPIAFIMLFVLRVGVKTIGEYLSQQGQRSPKVLIYGTQVAGIAIAKMLRSAGNVPYHPKGFIADPGKSSDFELVGMPVKVLNEKLFDWMEKKNIRHIIISPMKMREINPAKDLQIFIDHNIHILTTPYFTQYDDTDQIDAQRIGRIDSIQIEDLLERPEINIDLDNVSQILRNKVVLVSGAAGSIGSELVRQIQQFRPQVTILLEMAESPLHDLTLDLRAQFPEALFIPIIADVRNRNRMEEIFSQLRPDVVYHAAAYKHVPLMEDYPNEAVMANVKGTKNMADMAVKYGVQRFVMISTDKAVNPTNIMGASKRIAEIYVQSLYKKLVKQNPDCTKFITTRFGNVLGSNGSVIPYFKKQIAAGGPVTVTHPDIIRYFMTIPEACSLVMEASTLGNGGEIFIFDMGRPVKIVDLAKNMIRLAGFVPNKDIDIVFSGLRPGEKLYEELLNQKETTMPTSNAKIMIAKVREFDFDEVSKKVDELIATTTTTTTTTFTTVRRMKQLVPEFISNNSIYEELDQKN